MSISYLWFDYYIFVILHGMFFYCLFLLDYCGFSVLPMSIKRDTIIACCIHNDNNIHKTITIQNTNQQTFTKKEFKNMQQLTDTDNAEHHWTKYVTTDTDSAIVKKKVSCVYCW